MSDLGLYDSATGESLTTLKTVDVTKHQTGRDEVVFNYGRAKRGLIVQLKSGALRIHYFLNEPSGRKMMAEDCERFGFSPGLLLDLADEHAPVTTEQG